MTQEMKRDYTRRITQANAAGMVVITYELALLYLSEARQASSNQEFRDGVVHAKRCVEQLREVLDYAQPLSFTLMRLYNYISLGFDRAVFRNSTEYFEEGESILKQLHSAFKEAALTDTSSPLMTNCEDVYAGLTYGRGGANESVGEVRRGFTV